MRSGAEQSKPLFFDQLRQLGTQARHFRARRLHVREDIGDQFYQNLLYLRLKFVAENGTPSCQHLLNSRGQSATLPLYKLKLLLNADGKTGLHGLSLLPHIFVTSASGVVGTGGCGVAVRGPRACPWGGGANAARWSNADFSPRPRPRDRHEAPTPPPHSPLSLRCQGLLCRIHL